MSVIQLSEDLEFAIDEGRDALAGDSNDAEHDALFTLIEVLTAAQEPDRLPKGCDSWTDQLILFCGHGRCFRGRVIITPFAVVVINDAPKKALLGKVAQLARWHIDTDVQGYLNPTAGVFVLPRSALTMLEGDDFLKFV